jgi:AraC family transcriptional regulator
MRRLGFGEFLGERGRSATAGGFTLVEMLDTTSVPVPRHTHEDLHLLVVLNGHYETAAMNIRGRADAGTVVFNPAGTTHQDRFVTPDGRFLTISIDPERVRSLREVTRHSLEGDPIALKEPRARWLGRRLYEELGVADPSSALVLEGLALELIGQATRETSARRARPGWLVRAAELLTDRCSEAITVAEIAGIVGVHPWHLTRCFRAAYACTPGEYQRQCRAEMAVALLRQTRLSLSEIALRCGFADQSQFTRSFRRTLGITPGRCRSAH